MSDIKTAIGLMSGTSMDGIDVALLRTDGDSIVERGPSMSVPYDAAFRGRLAEALEDAKAIKQRHERPGNLVLVEDELTQRHADAVHTFLKAKKLLASDVDVVGFHGQTVLHRPDEALTVQIGLGETLSQETGITVVYDMRANDMVHGGQGAPLVPAYHAALAKSMTDVTYPVVFVNIGGISNLTFIGTNEEIIAYDCGPGNTLIDQWVEAHAGIPYDQGGMIASEGGIVQTLAAQYLDQPFFTSQSRKSLDRNDFRPPDGSDASLEDGARTLAYVTAAGIFKSLRHLPKTPKTFVICGGGRLNRMIMQDLAELARTIEAVVVSADEVGFNGDSMEAEAWAYLAVRSMRGLPLTFPGTTGVEVPVTGGVLVKPHESG